jgi:hypothetical protein
MRVSGAMLLVLLSLGCTSMATPPPPSELPSFSFSTLRGSPVHVVVLDQRAGERDARWTQRVESDLAQTLAAAGASVSPSASTRFEVRILRARSDFENRQWNGCVEVTGRVVGSTSADASGSACVTKSNLWGKATADNVLRLAYQDAMVKMLSALDARLSQ